MDPGKAVIAMVEAHHQMTRAAELASQQPHDSRVRLELQSAKKTFSEFSMRIVPQALKSMPIPARRFIMFQKVPGHPELTKEVTVALTPKIDVRLLNGDARQKALAWLVDAGHGSVALRIRGPFSRKEEQSICWRRTMTQFAKEQIDLGREPPWGLLGIRVKMIARFIGRVA